jgi:hypothetical protein
MAMADAVRLVMLSPRLRRRVNGDHADVTLALQTAGTGALPTWVRPAPGFEQAGAGAPLVVAAPLELRVFVTDRDGGQGGEIRQLLGVGTREIVVRLPSIHATAEYGAVLFDPKTERPLLERIWELERQPDPAWPIIDPRGRLQQAGRFTFPRLLALPEPIEPPRLRGVAEIIARLGFEAVVVPLARPEGASSSHLDELGAAAEKAGLGILFDLAGLASVSGEQGSSLPPLGWRNLPNLSGFALGGARPPAEPGAKPAPEALSGLIAALRRRDPAAPLLVRVPAKEVVPDEPPEFTLLDADSLDAVAIARLQRLPVRPVLASVALTERSTITDLLQTLIRGLAAGAVGVTVAVPEKLISDPRLAEFAGRLGKLREFLAFAGHVNPRDDAHPAGAALWCRRHEGRFLAGALAGAEPLAVRFAVPGSPPAGPVRSNDGSAPTFERGRISDTLPAGASRVWSNDADLAAALAAG